jgi:cell wall-associated NlpC family hydrolase
MTQELYDAISRRALLHVGKPYFIGADGPDEFDCNGLVFDVLRRNGLRDCYPGNRRTAAELWQGWQVVPWSERQCGDVACFGDTLSGCHHVVLVVKPDLWVGANHGSRRFPKESDATYRARLAQADRGAGARVCVVNDDYWASARLGVVRPHTLFQTEAA